MKQLNEYETPLTDKAIKIHGTFNRGTNEYIKPELARDLERKLAMCRDALGELLIDVKIAQENMNDAAKRDARWSRCADAIHPRVDAAKQALNQTK